MSEAAVNTAEALLTLNNIEVVYDEVILVLRGVSLEVPKGEIVTLLGPNGAGKTTVFNLLTTFLTPTRGEILYRGKNITSMKANEIARLGLVRSFQISAVFGHMSVLENVRVALQQKMGNSFHFWKSERSLRELDDKVMQLLAEVDLQSFAQTLAVELPYGRKRALELIKKHNLLARQRAIDVNWAIEEMRDRIDVKVFRNEFLLADSEDLGDVFAPSPGDLGDRQQPLYAADVDKCPEIAQ